MNIEHNFFGIATFWRDKLRHKLGAKNFKKAIGYFTESI